MDIISSSYEVVNNSQVLLKNTFTITEKTGKWFDKISAVEIEELEEIG